MTWFNTHVDGSTFGDRMADKIAAGMGSWTFIIIQSIFVLLWIGLNTWNGWAYMWDTYPFILLNLLFSTQAAYAAPVIMMAQNRAADRDRTQAQHDYDTNTAAKAEIEALQTHLHQIEDTKLDAIIELLKK